MKLTVFDRGFGFFDLLLVFIPISIAFAMLKMTNLLFIASILAIIPLARLMGRATEDLAVQTSPVMGALLLATFGNLIELIIAVLALRAGLDSVVKASITGSIVANLLLLIGLSMFFGGLKYKEQRFNRDSASVSSTMLIIAVTGLAIPTIYALTTAGREIQQISTMVSVVLAAIYLLGIAFTLFTHKHLFDPSDRYVVEKKVRWSKRFALAVLFGATVLVAAESEFLVSTIVSASKSFGISELFIGLVIVSIITNIAEKMSAVGYAMQNKVDLSLEIGTSSAIQIALFVVPALVLASNLLGRPLTLVFTIFELAAVLFAVIITNYLSADGRCNWLEGAQLIAVYAIILIVFYFL
ncbi:MAG: calcium/proton exchanger [Candidatus Aenigmarchaeota archaeon]|nr:calcium/proton exchanger [Candidatus Aenigmarchaeota archaeon]